MPTPVVTTATLDPLALEALRVVIRCPYLIQEEIGQRIQVRGKDLTKVRDRLVQAGLLRPIRLHPYVLWEILPAAAAIAGCAVPKLAGGGGYAHRWLMARIAAWARRTCRRVETEFPWGSGGRLDVYAERPDGTLLAWEIMLSLSNLATTLAKLQIFSGVSTIVVADTAAVAKVGAAVSRQGLFFPSSPHVVGLREMVRLSTP